MLLFLFVATLEFILLLTNWQTVVNLTKIYSTATLKGEYNSQDVAASPLQNYLLCEPDEATLLNPLTNAPYLKGYLGEQGNQLGGNYNLFYQLPGTKLY